MVVILCGNGKSWNWLSSLSVFLLPLIRNFNCVGLYLMRCSETFKYLWHFWTSAFFAVCFFLIFSKCCIRSVKKKTRMLYSWIWFPIHSFHLVPHLLLCSLQCNFSNSLAICPTVVHLDFFLVLLFYNLIPFPLPPPNKKFKFSWI